ncbi:MAG: hypothetical protein CHACPFDD_04180 [Phycisphaerae bacterium]|nr:hypothetical protein [Phycisphaerae bacterium]
MGPNVKVASLVSLSFIGTMSWLLNGMARPTAELPMAVPGVMMRAAAESAPGAALASVPFERPSAVAPLPEMEDASPRIAMPSTALGPLAMQAEPVVPPLDGILPDRNEAPRDAAPATDDVVLTAVAAPAAPMNETPSGLNATDAVVPSQGAERAHVVVKGDTLSKIARSEWKRDDPGALKLLLAANPQLKGRADRIRVGQRLTIPRLEAGAIAGTASPSRTVPRAAEAAGKPTPGPAAGEKKEAMESRGAKKSAKVAAAERGRDASGKSSVTRGGRPGAVRRTEDTRATTKPARWYTIQPSDSLRSIARRYLRDDRRWREIAELNELNARRPVEAGRRIKLPPA